MNKANPGDDSLPKFFKVYLPDDSGDDLEIPISFSSFLAKPFPKTITVRSISGNIWKLALRKCCGDTERFVMVNGWKRIVKDEALRGGDFLVFEFDGSSLFNFCIYEQGTTCKRMRRSSEENKDTKLESGAEEEPEASDDVLAVDVDDDDDSEDSDYNYAEDNDGDAAVEEEDNDGDESGDYIVEDAAAIEDDDDDVEAAKLGDDGDDCDDDDDDDDDDDGDDERQYLDDSENPSFTVILNPKKKSQLLIPARVIKDYDLHFPESITLVDPLVKKFGTLEKQIKIQTNGSVFVKGFGSIIRRNKVKTTDKMICEIKMTGESNLVQTIKIHIISG